MTVHAFLGVPGTGTTHMERPGGVGNTTDDYSPTTYTDGFMVVRFSSRVGAAFLTVPEGYVVQPGDLLEFDIMIPTPLASAPNAPLNTVGPSSGWLFTGGLVGGTTAWTDDTGRTTCYMGLDLKFAGGPYTSDLGLADIATGIPIGADGDKLPIGNDVWTHMTADLSQFAYMMLDRQEVACDEDTVHRFVMFLRHVVITNGGVTAYTIFDGYQNPYQTRADSSNAGYYSGYFVRMGLQAPLNVFGDLSADGTIVAGGGMTGTYSTPSVTIITGTTYTVPNTVGLVYSNSTTVGGMTMTLFAANSVPAGQRIAFYNLHATHTLTISRAGADTIDGATTKGPYGQYAGITLVSDGVSAFHQVP